MIGARAGLRVSPVTVPADERPAALAECPGAVARLDEQIIEPASLINDLREQHRARILKIDSKNGLEFTLATGQRNRLIRLINPNTGDPLDLRPREVVLAAGAGNAALREQAGLSPSIMQRRSLHMVMIRGGMGDGLPIVNGHCVDGSTTRVTITSTRDYTDRVIWQVGGRIAEFGVSMKPRELTAHARRELEAVLPGVSFAGLEWATYRVDRAEPSTRGGGRPDNAFAASEADIITAWPTKLALVPEMVRQVMTLLDTGHASMNRDATRQVGAEKPDDSMIVNWPRPIVALPPWETVPTWFVDI
jgi:hypothetical protein